MTDLDRTLQRARNEMIAQRYGRVERHWERIDRSIHLADINESRELDDWPFGRIA